MFSVLKIWIMRLNVNPSASLRKKGAFLDLILASLFYFKRIYEFFRTLADGYDKRQCTL